ncbi:GNAT family N-acetyltransferase [Sphingomonas sp. SM33]|jgi:ribosomal-protein-alanine N-acetyltransferase|uniref:GNAT family N-acetyltransferase n=1 Tax=Sphingomonas telluris TaxID=2907998 RepID=A0ABS9VIU6_9SPHN|nr:GNAT family N-acetyltransferase [Sphingomonas telluris]MCH8614613.1 GNAT family N-acetyltransferase [Sphingomonas telluris]
MSSRAESAAELHLTKGGSADLDSVVEVMNAAFDERFGEAWTRSQCAGILPMPGVELVIARDADAQTAGFSLYRTIADEAELLLLAVAPPFRRRGIGRMLLNHFLSEARGSGASRIHLEVREGNPAVMMYRAAGFLFAGRRRKYYRGRFGGEFDALTLSRVM